ncbi:MAG: type I restriction enzyme HsdR N-terminal domain-containing protein [Alistipes sp.]|nr:type I restriction enzyme HsdR N-terminal domain-containing protein [Alistipes sp.]
MVEGVKLAFPKISIRTQEVDGENFIWDSLRQKWLVLTPEEWVRQHAIGWLVSVMQIPALRISQEYPVNINGQHQRADIVVIDEFAKPYILVECKAPDINIDNEVVMQACRYNAVVGAKYILLTNGRKIFCYEYDGRGYRPVRSFR